jgi:kinesin family protein 2/24
MVVEWKPPYIVTDGIRPLALILSSVEGSGEGEEKKYTCAQVAPGFMHGSLEVYIWRQVEVRVGAMLKEVLLEYDVGTRYYYETL